MSEYYTDRPSALVAKQRLGWNTEEFNSEFPDLEFSDQVDGTLGVLGWEGDETLHLPLLSWWVDGEGGFTDEGFHNRFQYLGNEPRSRYKVG